MKNKIFIHTNNRQGIGAMLSKFSFERVNSERIPVEFINVDSLDVFKNFSGKTYLRNGKLITYDPTDLQSFTLSRFMPPELMNYEGRALLVDPDIFAIKDTSLLFTMDMSGKNIAACNKLGAWDTSMMVLECNNLHHWKMSEILEQLESKKLDYLDLIRLKKENPETLIDMPRIWNNLDTLTPETKMIHMTNRITQPWSTGLAIDFTPNPLPKILGFIPREPIHKILGKYPTHYLPHPNNTIEKFFFTVAHDALKAGVVTEAFIQKEIEEKHLRPDFLEAMERAL